MLRRSARLAKWCWILLAATGCAFAQTEQAEPSHFVLENNGRKVGEATYQIDPADKGYHLKANYSFITSGDWVDGTENRSEDTAAAPGADADKKTDEKDEKKGKFKPNPSKIVCERDSDLNGSYELLKDWLVVTANRADENVSILTDPDRSHFIYGLKSSVQSIDQRNDLHPWSVVLNNFDPSGVQVLVSMAASHPSPGGEYWVILAQGKGVYIPARLTAADPADGKLNGHAIKLKHWQLAISDEQTDIWADSQNRLMTFVIPSEQVAYRREGFERGKTKEETLPGAEHVEVRHVSFTSDGLKFPATLVLPKDRRGPVPLVVMVAGSGPQDADETIGPNKPFRDIAYGLGTDGIATLRYDKRTRLAPETFNAHPDIDHEVTLDAAAAVSYGAALQEVDWRKVFILGHSLGGMMAPAIAARTPKIGTGSVRGLILLAAEGETPDKTIERQLAFQAKLHGGTPAQIDSLEKQWQSIFATIRNTNTPADRVEGVTPLKLPVGYWRSWLSQDPAAVLARLHKPALNMRGYKDIQVSEKDYYKLQDANFAPGSLGEQIPGLNHLFMPVDGDSTGAEYMKTGHVSPEVIDTIANWIVNIDKNNN